MPTIHSRRLLAGMELIQPAFPGFPPEPSTGFVYFGARNGHIKIGYSMWPERRAQRLKLSLLLVIPGTKADERRLHQRFRHLRQDREWFEAGADLLAYIVSLLNRLAAGLPIAGIGRPAGP